MDIDDGFTFCMPPLIKSGKKSNLRPVPDLPDTKFHCYGCYDKAIEEQNRNHTFVLKPTCIEKQPKIKTNGRFQEDPIETMEPGGLVTLPKYGWAEIPVCKACYSIVEGGEQSEDSLFYKATVNKDSSGAMLIGFPDKDSGSNSVVAVRRASNMANGALEEGKETASGMFGGMKKKAAEAKKLAEEQAKKAAAAAEKKVAENLTAEQLAELKKKASGALDAIEEGIEAGVGEARLMYGELDLRSRRPDLLVAKGLEEWSADQMGLDEVKDSTMMESAGNKYAGNLAVVPLNRIEHVVSGPPVEDDSQRHDREATGDVQYHELQLMVRDAKGRCNADGEPVRWIWSMKFCGENGKSMQMRIAAALLEAKDRFKDDKRWGTVDGIPLNAHSVAGGPGIPHFGTAMPWQQPQQSKVGSLIDQAKAAVKNKAFGMIASLFEKGFDCITASPWLRKVAQEPLSEIKRWVAEQDFPPEELAKRHEWALSNTGHNALGYACWFKDGTELQETLHYLTTVIKVTDSRTFPCDIALTLLPEFADQR